MRSNGLEVRPLTTTLGAEIFGVDISQPLGDDVVAGIRQAFLDHCVVFFRDQRLDVDAQKRFVGRFGGIFVHPNFGVGPDPEVVNIVRAPEDMRVVGEEWHTDATMMAEPPMGAVLYGVEIPPVGGDTLWASQYAAYEALSPTMKRMLEGLRAVHSDRYAAGPLARKNQGRATKIREDYDWQETTNLHPVVCTHHETGRKCLYVNHGYTVGIDGLSDAESKSLLDFLMVHGHRPEFTCRFQWQAGSVAFWDNRCTKHTAISDTRGYRRHVRRIQIAGGRPC